MSESENIKRQLEELKNHIKTNYQDSQPIKILENIGDYSFVIKFNQLLQFNITLTIQIPGKSILFLFNLNQSNN